MPIIQVKVSATPSPELVKAIADTLLDLTAEILHKKRDSTAVTIDFLPREHWVVGGKTLAQQNKHSFYFDIKIVDGSNTNDEKARYVAGTFDAFKRLLGDLHDESYVYVQDVRGAAYGYGGATQEYRYIKAKLSSAERS